MFKQLAKIFDEVLPLFLGCSRTTACVQLEPTVQTSIFSNDTANQLLCKMRQHNIKKFTEATQRSLLLNGFRQVVVTGVNFRSLFVVPFVF